MSTSNIPTFDLTKALVCLCALVASVAGVACIGVSGGNQPEGDLDEYFLRDVATVEAMGLPVYWLGTEFTVDGLVFRGPYVAEFGAEVEGGGVDATYLASLDGGNVDFALTTYSRDAWDLVEDRVTDPRLPGVTRTSVSVASREAELMSIPLGTRPVNQLRLIVEIGEVVVVATAFAGGATYPDGPDYNPFINNPDLLIQVMEDLRPYPE
jgi:hypothetical protein